MDRPRIVQLVRIVFSAVCGIVFLLLIVLWVRSFRWIDSIHGTGYPKEFWCESLCGELGLLVLTEQGGRPKNLRFFSRPPELVTYYANGLYDDWPTPFSTALGIRWTLVRGFGLVIPCWMPVVFMGTLATIPWIPWSRRYSLRTLLILTTLVAVLLGAFAYPVR
jgi:hypothetical protein